VVDIGDICRYKLQEIKIIDSLCGLCRRVIYIAKVKYQAEVIVRESEMMSIENWNIPETLSYGSEYARVDVKKSIMQPFFSDGKWKTETVFVDFLEKSEAVEWWFKNGDRDATFFAVPYQNGEQKPFYIDFIIKLKDGRVGLFDTKAGLTKEVAGPKIEGLHKYVQGQNKKNKKLFGGIVVNTDRNYHGRWVYFDRPSKDFRKDDFSNWQDLIL